MRQTICLLGGTGFVGGHLLHRLSAQYEVRVLSRNPSAQQANRVIPNVRFQLTDVYDVAQLSKHFADATAVINLIGILNDSGTDGTGFRLAHLGLVEGALDACGQAGVSQFIHLSALNAGQSDSHYLQTKGEAEALIRNQSKVPWTIFQPSVIFGPGDSFLNRFATLLKLSPVLPQPCPQAKFQPVYVVDVANAIARSIGNNSALTKTFQLAGPRTYTMLELIDYLRDLLAVKRLVIGLPDGLSRFFAAAMDRLPANLKPFSKDNYLSLQLDSVATENGLAQLGVRATPLETVAPKYIVPDQSPAVRSQRYQRLRERAGLS